MLKTPKTAGVKVVDAETGEALKFKSKIVFLCAPAMASVGILLNSKSKIFLNGMGNNYDEVGRNIMGHHYQFGASAKFDGHLNKYFKGRRPNEFYIPRFVQNKTEQLINRLWTPRRYKP